MVRFGRWKEILQLPFPRYPLLMLFRSASLHFARGLAFANTGKPELAITEANLFDDLRLNPSAGVRILHNNTVHDLLAVDAPMLRGEIAYFSGNREEAFSLLRKAVSLQDGLNFDEPWGKMQPIRHALGGLLCKHGHYDEAEQVFRADLKFHPSNPWGLVGLIACLQGRLKIGQSSCCKQQQQACTSNVPTAKPNASPVADRENVLSEVEQLEDLLTEQRKSGWADFEISVPCLCCVESQR